MTSIADPSSSDSTDRAVTEQSEVPGPAHLARAIPLA
jgi:hypothetical protein